MVTRGRVRCSVGLLDLCSFKTPQTLSKTCLLIKESQVENYCTNKELSLFRFYQNISYFDKVCKNLSLSICFFPFLHEYLSFFRCFTFNNWIPVLNFERYGPKGFRFVKVVSLCKVTAYFSQELKVL